MGQKEPLRDIIIWVKIATTFNLMYQEIKKELSKENLTIPQLEIIGCLAPSKGISLNELAERLLVTGGNVTGLIDRLERDGYVLRERNEKDRRIIYVKLTPKGKEIWQMIMPRYQACISQLTISLNVVEKKELSRLLKKLIIHIRKKDSGGCEAGDPV
jgi:MarR family 2-MHQ and catechol resistance regulon transcriptional repressor